MRSIEFYTKQQLEELITKLVKDVNELQSKFNTTFNDTNKFISFASWNMDELITIKTTIGVLESVLERLNGSDYNNTFEQYVIWHLVHTNFTQADKVQLIRLEVWREIYNNLPYVKEEWK